MAQRIIYLLFFHYTGMNQTLGEQVSIVELLKVNFYLVILILINLILVSINKALKFKV